VPACRSLDCVSIFALTADDAARVFGAAVGFDPDDCYSRHVPALARGTLVTPSPTALDPDAHAAELAAAPDAEPAAVTSRNAPDPRRAAVVASVASDPGVSSFRFGVPRSQQLEFFGDAEYRRLFQDSAERLESLGGRRVEIDFEPFFAAARLLYEGPWVAERYCAVGDFLERHSQAVLPVTRQIISGGLNPTAADTFRAQYRLMELRRAAEHAWQFVDYLLTPTAGTIYRITTIDADPIRLNSNLGYYTNFVNLLDLCAVAVPAGFRGDGLPFGITLLGRAGTDTQLLSLADRFHDCNRAPLGALSMGAAVLPRAQGRSARALATPDVVPTREVGLARPGANNSAPLRSEPTSELIRVAVCGAHMEGLPLNHQLTSRGAVLSSRTRTAPAYKFYALPGGPPHRPGLVRVPGGGASIEVEVWSVPAALFGSFVAGIPAPLGIGKVELQDGTQVCGFLCETYAISNATEITSLGSWRRYVP
jgi:allophanate hydrolase